MKKEMDGMIAVCAGEPTGEREKKYGTVCQWGISGIGGTRINHTSNDGGNCTVVNEPPHKVGRCATLLNFDRC